MMEPTNPANLFAEYTKMLTQFKLPGIDVGAVMEARRKDIEALAAANTAALAGAQTLGQKQAEIMRSTLASLQSMVEQVATSGVTPGANTGELVQKALHKALADMQDLADTAYRAQTESMAAITKRAGEHIEELKALLKPQGGDAQR